MSSNIGQVCEVIAIYIGNIYLRETNAQYWLDEISNRDALLQIVTIQCRASGDRQLDHFTASELREYIGAYEFYNVLWIEREKGIAFRRALGRIFKEAWESDTLSEIDVVLG